MCVPLRSTYPFFSSAIARSPNRDLLRWPLRQLVRRTFSTPPRFLGAISHLIGFASRLLGGVRLGKFLLALRASLFFCFTLISFASARAQNAVAQPAAVAPHAAASPSAGLQIEKQLKMISPEKAEGVSALGNSGAVSADGSVVVDGVVKGQKPPPVKRDQRVLDAAKMYEKYFLGQMMKAMRSTVNKSELEKQSMGEGIYREQLDDQYVDSWGDRGGIGLADMIHDELIGKAEMAKLRRQAMRAAKGKVRTPMALTDRDVMKVRRLPSIQQDGGTTLETTLVTLDKTTSRPGDGPESVRSPWAGKVHSIVSEGGKVVLRMDAEKTEKEPARKVELAFDGVPFQVTEGDVIKAGQTVGQLGKSARGILIRQTLVQDPLKTAADKGSAGSIQGLEPLSHE